MVKPRGFGSGHIDQHPVGLPFNEQPPHGQCSSAKCHSPSQHSGAAGVLLPSCELLDTAVQIGSCPSSKPENGQKTDCLSSRLAQSVLEVAQIAKDIRLEMIPNASNGGLGVRTLGEVSENNARIFNVSLNKYIDL